MESVAAEPRRNGHFVDRPAKPEISLVTHEIRYLAPEAGEVWLVWGVNGWKPLSESLRPANTIVKDGLMHTPMSREHDRFTVILSARPGTPINYGFLTTRTRTNAAVKLWQGDGPSKDFSLVAHSGGNVEIAATPVVASSPGAGRPAAPPTTLEIRYQTTGVDGVWFVWGVNGWQHTAEDSRPPGTIIKRTSCILRCVLRIKASLSASKYRRARP